MNELLKDYLLHKNMHRYEHAQKVSDRTDHIYSTDLHVNNTDGNDTTYQAHLRIANAQRENTCRDLATIMRSYTQESARYPRRDIPWTRYRSY